MSERTYWVIREGNVKGQGRYVGPTPGTPDYRDSLREAHRYKFVKPNAGLWGRTVKVTPKKREKPTVTVDGMRLLIDDKYVCNYYVFANRLSLEELAQRLRDALL